MSRPSGSRAVTMWLPVLSIASRAVPCDHGHGHSQVAALSYGYRRHRRLCGDARRRLLTWLPLPMLCLPYDAAVREGGHLRGMVQASTGHQCAAAGAEGTPAVAGQGALCAPLVCDRRLYVPASRGHRIDAPAHASHHGCGTRCAMCTSRLRPTPLCTSIQRSPH